MPGDGTEEPSARSSPDQRTGLPTRPGMALPRESGTYQAFLGWLDAQTDDLIDEWVIRLSTLSSSYSVRPTIELYVTVNEAFHANL